MSELFEHQAKYIDELPLYDGSRWPRTCLYYRTGAGKTFTSLLALERWGDTSCVVIAPPSTHEQWRKAGADLGIQVTVMSHAKFRMKDTKLSRRQALIVDEFHLLGGAKAQGFRKLQALARGLEASLQILSATPNYNDAERVYCVHNILAPHVTKGGYLQWMYEHCHTEQNPFAKEPMVTGFRDYKDAASFLADLPGVWHLPDERHVQIKDLSYDEDLPWELEVLGYNRRKHRVIASQIERRHTERYQGLVNDNGHIDAAVMTQLLLLLDHSTKVMVFSAHASVAIALSSTLAVSGVNHSLVTGSTPKQRKQDIIHEFSRTQGIRVLVGTASIATGTDGLDKVCDRLIILDDTDDDALRRQLIGRILPRGEEAEWHHKEVLRFVPA